MRQLCAVNPILNKPYKIRNQDEFHNSISAILDMTLPIFTIVSLLMEIFICAMIWNRDHV